MASGGFTIEDVDAITGPAIGRPKSATFRTMDIAGIDVLAHVARNLAERLDDVPNGRPSSCRRSSRRWSAADRIGRKAGAGFYKKDAVTARSMTLDPATLDIPPEAAGAAAVARSGAVASRTPASGSARCSSARTGRRVPARRRSAPTLALRRARRPRRSRIRSTTSIARCGGASAGSSVRSRPGTPSALQRRARRCGPTGPPPRLAQTLDAPCVSGRPRRRQRRPGRFSCCSPRADRTRRRPRRTPARAWWISATACSASSSTRR